MQSPPKVVNIQCVLLADRKSKSLRLPVYVIKHSHDLDILSCAFIDSGAGINCLDYNFVKKNCLPYTKLPSPITVRNVDSSINSGGEIKFSTTLFLRIGGITHEIFVLYHKLW